MRAAILIAFRSAPMALAFLSFLALPGAARAHCDTFDGPVVAAARAALESGELSPVLAWVRAEDESEIRAAFESTRTVRVQGDAARALADNFFFETLVRVHRAGEGFPYTGLRPAGAAVAPAIRAADAALESGAVDDLVAELTSAVEHGVRERFARASAARAHATENIAAGRAFVATYVQLTHYVEALEATAAGHAGEHGGDDSAPAAHAHD